MKFSQIKTKVAAVAVAGVLAVACAGLTACGASSSSSASDENTITIGATSTPHAEVLNNAVAPLLEEQGYTLEVTVFEDYVQPNTAVDNGELDANYFQHVNYLNSFNDENGTELVNAGYVHYEPFGIYAGKSSDLANIQDGASIAVPNDTTNEARALLLLQQEGLITLADDVDITATVQDIVDNPHNLQFNELEAAQVSHSLQDVDFAIINGNYALEAGLNVSDALAVEANNGVVAEQYGNIIAVKAGNEDSAKIKALIEACQDASVKTYIEDTYAGAVVPLSVDAQ